MSNNEKYIDEMHHLEADIGIKFNNINALMMSITHSSFINESPNVISSSNERLEFLGDALLGSIIASELYSTHDEMDEGALTELRASLVRAETLTEIAKELNLGNYLLLGQGEEQTGGRKRPSNLSRAFEALLGAIFLDQGYEKLNKFVTKLFKDRLSNNNINHLQDPKSKLQEFVQRTKKTAPTYTLVKETGPEHHKLFTVDVYLNDEIVGSGNGKRKLDAERNAAEDALVKLIQIDT
jgi:ribonuclease-3